MRRWEGGRADSGGNGVRDGRGGVGVVRGKPTMTEETFADKSKKMCFTFFSDFILKSEMSEVFLTKSIG